MSCAMGCPPAGARRSFALVMQMMDESHNEPAACTEGSAEHHDLRDLAIGKRHLPSHVSGTVESIESCETGKEAEEENHAVGTPTTIVDDVDEDKFGALYGVCSSKERDKNEQ